MASKRKASPGDLSPEKRRQQGTLNNDDPIYEEAHSDTQYSALGTPSIGSHDMHETPTTPFSTTSTRYPSELKTHLCPFEGCTKAFNRPARLQEHIRSHNNERLFQCTYEGCDKTFLRASHLQHHVKSAHTGVRDYVCDRPGCGKSFVTGSRLRRHIDAHDGQDKYRCTEFPPCHETFRKHSTLQKHIIAVHLHEKPFPCTHIDLSTGQKCTMAFDTAGRLRAHESRIHTEKRFSCAECSTRWQEQASEMDTADDSVNRSFTYPTYALLQEHIRAAHPPKCPNCPIVCSTPRELRRHLEVAHGDVSLEERKVFACTFEGCDRTFTKRGNLTVHIRTVHEGEKRFGCGETDLSTSKKVVGWDGIGCGKRYGSKLALEEHIRTAHLGFQNAKAERRQRLGLSGKTSRNSEPRGQMSTLAALTGQGYAEETGRQIACFYETCNNRFHRDFDLWMHMTAKHGCSEDEVQGLFLQRALLADQNGTGANALGIYGLEFDRDSPSISHESIVGNGTTFDVPGTFTQSNGISGFQEQTVDTDFVMQDYLPANTLQDIDSTVASHREVTLLDPVLECHMMED